MKRVVIFIGPPGSGKDTQAGLLVDEFGYVQVPSSQIIKSKFAEHPEQKAIFDAGKLNDPALVAQWIIEFVRTQAAAGKGVIFSGSPRTTHEAQVELEALSELYGLEQILVVYLKLDEEEAKHRTVTRRICKANGHPFPNTPEYANLRTCPKDGSELYTRALDDPGKYAIRLNEYKTLTEPCLAVLEKGGLAIHTVEGARAVEAIHHDIVNLLERDKEAVLS